MKIKTKRKLEAMIPSASMSDIAFLLIIFFMVSTVFNVDVGVNLILPESTKPETIKDKKGIHITIPNQKDPGEKIAQGQVSVEGEPVSIDNLTNKLLILRNEKPEVYYVILKADESVPFSTINLVLKCIKDTKITNIKLATNFKKK